MRKIVALVALAAMSIASYAVAWDYKVIEDKMTGDVLERRVQSLSENDIEGWLNVGTLLLVVDCGTPYVWMIGSDFGGFDHTGGRAREHKHRIMFDTQDPFYVTFRITESLDQAHMVSRIIRFKNEDGEWERAPFETYLLDHFLTSESMKIEVAPYNTNDKEIAIFSLEGFAEAWAECPE